MPDSKPELSPEEQAKAARASLKLFRVTATRKHRVPAPILELHPGTNGFEVADEEAAKPLLARLAELVATGDIEVHVLDGDGNATEWEPPAKS